MRQISTSRSPPWVDEPNPTLQAKPGDRFDPGAPWLAFGIAGFTVRPDAFKLQVTVAPDKAVYRPRDKAKVRIQVRDGQGGPVPGSEVVVAAVDEALLQLKANGSWDALGALLRKRGYQVTGISSLIKLLKQPQFMAEKFNPDLCPNCAFRQEIVAAAPHRRRPWRLQMRRDWPGRGRGLARRRRPATLRELFDTLLLWQTRIKVDAQGNADVEVPLNDSLSEFRIVAVANSRRRRAVRHRRDQRTGH